MVRLASRHGQGAFTYLLAKPMRMGDQAAAEHHEHYGFCNHDTCAGSPVYQVQSTPMFKGLHHGTVCPFNPSVHVTAKTVHGALAQGEENIAHMQGDWTFEIARSPLTPSSSLDTFHTMPAIAAHRCLASVDSAWRKLQSAVQTMLNCIRCG